MNDETILIVEDDPLLAEIMVSTLVEEGYPVRLASNGQEALALLAHLRPALVLLDMRMPVLDGWGFATALRRTGIDVPLVVVTAAQDASAWAAQVGAVGYVEKPFLLEELASAVNQFALCPVG